MQTEKAPLHSRSRLKTCIVVASLCLAAIISGGALAHYYVDGNAPLKIKLVQDRKNSKRDELQSTEEREPQSDDIAVRGNNTTPSTAPKKDSKEPEVVPKESDETALKDLSNLIPEDFQAPSSKPSVSAQPSPSTESSWHKNSSPTGNDPVKAPTAAQNQKQKTSSSSTDKGQSQSQSQPQPKPQPQPQPQPSSNGSASFKASFYANGANLLLYGETTDSGFVVTCETENATNGCDIPLPSIQRDNADILGYGNSATAKEATITSGNSVHITADTDFYAITRTNLTATFTFPRGDHEDIKQSCYAYNTEYLVNCKIVFPGYENIGGFENTWYESPDEDTSYPHRIYGTDLIYADKTYYAAYRSPYYTTGVNESTDEDDLCYKDRNLTIQRTYTKGQTRFEYEAGIPTWAIDNHIAFLDSVYEETPWIFQPSKAFVMTSDTYNQYSFAYGLTYGPGESKFVDLQFDAEAGKISENATIHELAHVWDSYYGFRTGKMLRYQSDINDLYEELKAQNRVYGLSIAEWFAGTSTEYYWHHLHTTPTEPSFAGFRDAMTDEQRARYVKIYEKYVKITQDNFVGAARNSRIADVDQNLLLNLYGLIKRALAK